MGRIVVTGATGKLGSGVLKNLLKLVPADDIIVSQYNPNGSKLKELGVEVRRGDFNDTVSLRNAYAGADNVFIVSSPSMDEELRERQHSAAIDAAIDSGAKRIVYTSLAFASDSESHVMKPHLATEKYLKKRQQELGDKLEYTILREGVYTESYPVFLGFLNDDSEEVVVSGDGGIAWVAREDLAEATGKILARHDPRDKNATHLLSGEKAYTLEETTEIISQARGKPLKFRNVSANEYKEYHSDMMDVAAAWENTYPALERGEAAETSTTLREVLGRAPTDVIQKFTELARAKSGNEEKDSWLEGATRKQI